MIPARITVIRNAPKMDHQWRFVIRQLRISPPVAFEFSIMIAGEYRLIAMPTYKATRPPTASKTKPPQLAPMAVAGFTDPPAANGRKINRRGTNTSPRMRRVSRKFAPRMLRNLSRFFFQAEDGIRDLIVTGVQTCALPI